MAVLGLEPHPLLKGFYRSKRHSKVFVNRYGVVISESGKVLPVSIYNGYQQTFGGAIHRHVAETFLRMPAWLAMNKRVVNHKNGVKTDNRRSNLEWTDARGNAAHALRTGLRAMNNPVLVKDLRTGEFVEHFSIQDTARHYGLNASEIKHALKPKFVGKVWKKYYGIILKGQDWPQYNTEDLGKTLNGFKRELVVVDTETGEKVIYVGYYLFSERTGVRKGTLMMRLVRAQRLGINWVSEGKFQYTYVDTYDGDDLESIPMEDFSHPRPDLKIGFKKAWKVLATNVQDDKQTVYNSLRDCCLDLNISFSTTQRKLVDSRVRLVGKWEIRYLDSQATTVEML